MDKFMNLAKQGVEAYNQSGVNKTGGQELNSPHNIPQSDYSYDTHPEIDHDEAIKGAEKSGSGDSSLFSTALGFLSENKKEHGKPLDDNKVTEAHERAYGKNDTSGMDAGMLGSAAALEVVKKFTGGSSHGSSSSSGHGGNSQTQFISMAMAEATKLFDKSGGAASGNKQDAVNSAAMTVMKLLVQSKFSGAGTTGGSNSGGLGALLSLASKK